MKEIQISADHQGNYGIFRTLYRCVTKDLPGNLKFVEAHANKNNEKSIAILNRLGLKQTRTNQTGTSFYFTGTYEDCLIWLNGK